ncbi:MAG: fibronectin type III domain-containing protein [Myxococcales bacterium]|nr:fibronectin type III domain-containing protein [Myxococcales bacterium]
MRAALPLLLILSIACADTTPPSWPADAELAASALSDEVTLSWPAASDDKGVTGYRVLRDDVEIATVGGDARQHVVANLSDATEYAFSVQPIDEAGNRGEMLHARATTTDGTAPTWPAGARLTAEAVLSDGEAPTVVRTILTWPAADDAVGVTGYRLVHGALTLAELGEVTRHELEGAAPEAIEVIAVDAAGNVSSGLALRADEVPADEVPAGEEAAPEIGEAAETGATTEGDVSAMLEPVQLDPRVLRAVERLRIGPEGLKVGPNLNPERLQIREGLRVPEGAR